MPITRQEPRPLAAYFPNRAASNYSLAETSAGWGEPVPRQKQTASPRKIEAGGRQTSEMPSLAIGGSLGLTRIVLPGTLDKRHYCGTGSGSAVERLLRFVTGFDQR